MSIKSMQDEIKQILNVYRHYLFLVATHLSDGVPVVDGHEVPCESISEEVPFSKNIENLLKNYPFKFQYDHTTNSLIYDGCMDEEEYEEYKQMVSSSRELETLAALNEMSQIGDVYYNAEILEGVDMLRYLDKTKCTTPQAAELEMEKAKSAAMKTLQESRNSMEDSQTQKNFDGRSIKIATQYEIVPVHSGVELVQLGILPKRVKRWCKELGMPYKYEDITGSGK